MSNKKYLFLEMKRAAKYLLEIGSHHVNPQATSFSKPIITKVITSPVVASQLVYITNHQYHPPSLGISIATSYYYDYLHAFAFS